MQRYDKVEWNGMVGRGGVRVASIQAVPTMLCGWLSPSACTRR